MAQYTPPPTALPVGPEGGKGKKRLKPLTTGPAAPPAQPVTTVPTVPGSAPQLRPPVAPAKKEDEGEWSWENVGKAFSPQKSADFLANAIIAAPAAVFGLGTGLFKGGDKKGTEGGSLSIPTKVFQALLGTSFGPIALSETGEEYSESLANTFTGKNIRLAGQAIKRGETPLPYLMEDAGNAAIVLGGTGAVLKGASAGGRISAAGAARLNRVGAKVSKAANVADWIGDAPIRLPIEAVSKSVSTAGKYGRYKANNLRAEAARREALDPMDPEVMSKRAKANRLEARWGKEIDRGGIVTVVTQKLLGTGVGRAVLRANKNGTKIVREMTEVADKPLFWEDLGPMTPEENQAVFAIINGRAALIEEVAQRTGQSVEYIAEIGRYNFEPGYSLTPAGARMASDYLNGRLSPQQSSRIQDAAQKVSARLEIQTEQARGGYGRKTPLTPSYDIPFPSPDKFADAMARIGRSDVAEEIGALYESGFFNDLQDPRVIEYMRARVEAAPESVALDSTLYPPKERNNVEFYKRVREALLAQGEATIAGFPRPPGDMGGPSTGVPPQDFYTTNKYPGDLVRTPAQNIKRSIKILERLRGKNRKLAEQIVDAELRIRKLEFIVIKAQYKIGQLAGYYTDADGNLVSPDSPEATNYVPGMLEKLQAERNRLKAIDDEMRATQSDSTVVNGVIVNRELVEENLAVVEDGIAAVEAGIAELEDQIDTATAEIDAEEGRQIDAGDQLDEAGENPDEIIAAAKADVEEIPGDPDAYSELAPTDEQIAALQDEILDLESAISTNVVDLRKLDIEITNAKLTRDDASKTVEPETLAAAPAAEGFISADQLLAILEKAVADKTLPAEVIDDVKQHLDTTYVAPTKDKEIAKAADEVLLSAKNGGYRNSGGYPALVSNVNGELWFSNGYMATKIPGGSKAAELFKEPGRYTDPWGQTLGFKTVGGRTTMERTIGDTTYRIEENVVGKTKDGKDKKKYTLSQLDADGNVVAGTQQTYGSFSAAKDAAPKAPTSEGPDFQKLIDLAKKAKTDKQPPAKIEGQRIATVTLDGKPTQITFVFLRRPDGQLMFADQQQFNVVYKAGDTVHLPIEDKASIIIKRDGNIIGLVMPFRNQELFTKVENPLSPDTIATQIVREGNLPDDIVAALSRTAEGPRLAEPKAVGATDAEIAALEQKIADLEQIRTNLVADTVSLRDALDQTRSELEIMREEAAAATQIQGALAPRLKPVEAPTDVRIAEAQARVDQLKQDLDAKEAAAVEAQKKADNLANLSDEEGLSVAERQKRLAKSVKADNAAKKLENAADEAWVTHRDAVAELEALKAGSAAGPVGPPQGFVQVDSVIAGTELPEALDPPALESTGPAPSALNESDWTKIDDNNWSINTGYRSYLATRRQVGTTKAGKPQYRFILKRYGSDGLPIESTAQEFTNFKQARKVVDEGLQYDLANPVAERPIFRPGRELTAGSGNVLSTAPELIRAEQKLASGIQRLKSLERTKERATAKVDKLRVDQAARRARLSLLTSAEVRAEARLGKEIVTQPDVAVTGQGPTGRVFIGQETGAPSVARPLSESGVPVAPGEGFPAMLRPTAQTVRFVDETTRQINEVEAAQGAAIEDRTRNVDVVVQSIDAANLRRRTQLPPGLPLRSALNMPRAEGQPFIGSQYAPAGRPTNRTQGAIVEIQEGLIGDTKASSEYFREGTTEEIYDPIVLANRLVAEQMNLDMTEAFRSLMRSAITVNAEELLGRDVVQNLRKEAYDRAYSWAGGRPATPEGVAAYAEGLPNRAAVAARKEAEIYGDLINKEMEKQGFVTLPLTGRIERGVPTYEIDESTPYLPKYTRERVMRKATVYNPDDMGIYLRTASRVTTGFKNLTLPFSFQWQIGDILGIFISAAVSGVNPLTLGNYMVDSLRANYGGPNATRGEIIRNVFREADKRGTTRIGEILAESGLQDVGLRIGEQQRLRGYRDAPERMTVPQQFLRDYTPNIKGDFNVGDIIPTWRKGMYRVNEAINRVGRHAFFLAKFQEAIDGYNARNGTSLTAESALEAGLHEKPGPIRDAFEDTVDSANDVMGDWMGLSPRERKYILPNATFYAWIKHIHKLFLKVAKENPSAIKWYVYLGNFAYDPDTDPFDLYTDKISLPGGFLAGSNFMNPFADVVGGPIGRAIVKGDPSSLLSPLSPLPRILGAGFLGENLPRLKDVSRPYGTGSVGSTGTERNTMLFRRPEELLGFSLQQFPIATRVLDILPTGTIPGTNIQTGPYQRYDTGQARLRPGTLDMVPKAGGRAVAAARLLGLPFLPTATRQQMSDIERTAKERLVAFEEAQKRAKALQG